MMAENYENLNYNIESHEYEDQMTEEAWSCYAGDYTAEFLENFTDGDWEQLYRELPKKSVLWQKRFVDCVPETVGPCELKALRMIAEGTEDTDLFGNVIGILSDQDLGAADGLGPIFDKAERMLPLAEHYLKPYIRRFLEKRPGA